MRIQVRKHSLANLDCSKECIGEHAFLPTYSILLCDKSGSRFVAVVSLSFTPPRPFCFVHLAFTTVQRLSCSVSSSITLRISVRNVRSFTRSLIIVVGCPSPSCCSRNRSDAFFCSPDRSLSSPGVGFHSRPQAVICRPLPSVVFRCRPMLAFDTPGLLLVVCASRFPISRSRSFEQTLVVGRRFLVCFLFCE